MTTPPIETITDELLAELEEECALAAELDINAAVVPAHITALLAHIADLKDQASEREAHVRNLIDSETLLFNYLADIRQAVGDDGRLMLPGLVEHIRGMSQQLVAAGVTADNCELFRKDSERMRYALERLAEAPGCGCSFPCRCGGAEWTRAELEGRMDLAAEALARPAGGGS